MCTIILCWCRSSSTWMYTGGRLSQWSKLTGWTHGYCAYIFVLSVKGCAIVGNPIREPRSNTVSFLLWSNPYCCVERWQGSDTWNSVSIGLSSSRVSLWAMFTLHHRRQALNRRVNEVIQYLTALHIILLMFLCATRFCDNLCSSLSMISRYRCKLLVRVSRWTCQCYLCKRTLINILGSVRFHHELEVEHWMN